MLTNEEGINALVALNNEAKLQNTPHEQRRVWFLTCACLIDLRITNDIYSFVSRLLSFLGPDIPLQNVQVAVRYIDVRLQQILRIQREQQRVRDDAILDCWIDSMYHEVQSARPTKTKKPS